MRIALHNFTGGEVSPILAARYDLSRYGSSVQCMENMLPGLHGDVRRRPGTLFLGSLEDEAVLLPFSFNALAEQNFVLVLSGNGLSIADIHGFDPQEGSIPRLPTPYEARHLLEICAAQVGDTVYLAHTAYPLHKLVRSTDSEPESPLPENAIRSHGYRWTLEAVALNSSLPAPQAPSCTFVRGNNDDDAGLGYTLRYKIVAVDANGKQSLASEAGSCNGKHPSDWVVGNRTDISWTAVEGATEYNIYREEAGYYGFIGVSSGTTFSDNNYQADTADTPREDWDPFADGNNPSVVAFHQQRMVLAGTRDSPQAFYLSRSGDFENFRKSRPLQDDDPVEYLIASGSIDAIAWAASFGDLLLGTSGSEYKASGNGSAITPGNITITAQSYWGSAGLAPIIIGNAILHVQRHGAHVRDLFYSLEKDGYAGNDLSILAPHLFEGHRLRQWAYQQTPGSVLWIVRDDGLLLALTYLKEHDIWGWSRHPTAVLGIAIAVLILNLVVLVVVPTQTPVELSQTVTEYALDDEAFAQTHTLTLTGTLTKSMLHKSLFHGTLTVSGIDGMEQPYMLMLTREDGKWVGLSDAPFSSISAGKDMDELLIVLQSGQDAGTEPGSVHFLAPDTGNRHAALVRLYTYYPAYRTK